ncbi:hypothetical protein [Pirellulimonas nuda]|nr:hypothetical protein [Pirellulimonas nuda]
MNGSEVALPPLSTVCPDAFGMGYRAAQTLDRLMKGLSIEQETVLGP